MNEFDGMMAGFSKQKTRTESPITNSGGFMIIAHASSIPCCTLLPAILSAIMHGMNASYHPCSSSVWLFVLHSCPSTSQVFISTSHRSSSHRRASHSKQEMPGKENKMPPKLAVFDPPSDDDDAEDSVGLVAKSSSGASSSKRGGAASGHSRRRSSVAATSGGSRLLQVLILLLPMILLDMPSHNHHISYHHHASPSHYTCRLIWEDQGHFL